MNDDNHNTSAGNAEANATDIVESETPSETRKNSRMALYLAFLALFFTALGITVGYKHWLRIHDKAKLALSEITIIKEQLTHTADNSKVEKLQKSLTQTSNEAEQKLSNALQELDQIRQQTLYSAKTVTEQIRELTLQQSRNKLSNSLPSLPRELDTTNRTLETEVRFLLISAKRSLTINHDKISSLQQLNAADQLLLQIASPELLPVREKLVQDIVRLEQLSVPNIEELSLLISQLESDIKPLSTLETELPEGEKINLFVIDNTNSLSGKVKNYINDSISISKQANPPRYALSLVDKQRTDQLLKLRLESLRLMLLQHHNTTYHQQIRTIKHMLDLYYSPADTKPWLAVLEKLDDQNLVPSYPDISTALKQLTQISIPIAIAPKTRSLPAATTASKDTQ